MPFRFSTIILIFIALFGGAIYILHLFNLVTASNEVYARFTALGIFIAGFGFLGWQKARHHRFSWDDIYKNNTLIIVALTVLLVGLFLDRRIGHYMTGVFAGVSLLHLAYTRKFYFPPKFFYFVVGYTLLLLVGTLLGEPSGLRYLDKTLPFYVFPLAFCCFRLSKKNLFDIADVFFKTSIIFLSLCVLYWWFNFLHLDADLTGWIASKTFYHAEMTGWLRQADMLNVMIRNKYELHEFTHFSAYFFVNSWAHYFHPTYVSFTLISGLILGFYLHHKRKAAKRDLILYIVLCFSVIALMQSRIGIVGLFFTLAFTGLYYLKLTFKRRYFVVGIAMYLLLGSAGAFVFKNEISEFKDDDIRDGIRMVTISYIQENFWRGAGMRRERAALEQQAEKIREQLPANIFPNNYYHTIVHAHNQFLGDMVQFGIWGLTALLAMLTAIAHYAIKNRSYLLQMLLGVLLLLMMIDSPLYGQSYRVLAILFFFTAISESVKLKLKNEI